MTLKTRPAAEQALAHIRAAAEYDPPENQPPPENGGDPRHGPLGNFRDDGDRRLHPV